MEMIVESVAETGIAVTLETRISAEKLAAFLDGRLGDEERTRVEAILAADPDARAEMIAAARLVAEVEQPSLRRRDYLKWIGIAAAAAAAIAVLVVPVDFSRDRTPDAVTERQSATEDGGRILLLSPSETDPVAPRTVAFEWRAERSASYRLTVADSSGSTVWTTTTEMARAALPAAVRLAGGSRYYWYVDAILLDGSSITSGPRAFVTMRP